MYNVLKKKIIDKTAIISVIGLGYVGLPLVISFVKKGFKVIGLDNDINKIELLKKGKSYIKHIKFEKILSLKKKNFIATADFSLIKKADIIIICLPTPIKKNFTPEMKYLYQSVKLLKNNIKKGQAIVLESTTYPGTTEEIYEPMLKKLKMVIGKDFFLIYSPEREDPGNKQYNINNTIKIISGKTTKCKEIAKNLYLSICNNVFGVENIRTAEMTKLYENIFRSINISFVNEMKVILEKLDINIYSIIEAAKTKPFGFMPFYPGPGLGGHCIPVDPFLFAWKAKKEGLDAQFIKLSGKVNRLMPKRIYLKTVEILKKKQIKNKKILILGLSYKKNIDDIRESPSLEIINFFKKNNFSIDYSDPFFLKIPKMRNYSFNFKGKIISKKMLKNYAAVIIATDHDKFNYNLILKYSNIIIDTRGKLKDHKKVFQA